MSIGAEPAAESNATLAAPRTPADLFIAFTMLALQGFGGVLPVAQRELVDKRRWLTREQFLETLSMGQVLPGPNVVNIALIVGDGYLGQRGALAALAGILTAPLAIVLTLAVLYAHFATDPMVAGAVRGMGAASAGLIVATAFKLVPTLKRNPLPLALCGAAVVGTWVLVGLLRVPMAWVVLGLGAAMVVFGVSWLRRRTT